MNFAVFGLFFVILAVSARLVINIEFTDMEQFKEQYLALYQKVIKPECLGESELKTSAEEYVGCLQGIFGKVTVSSLETFQEYLNIFCKNRDSMQSCTTKFETVVKNCLNEEFVEFADIIMTMETNVNKFVCSKTEEEMTVFNEKMITGFHKAVEHVQKCVEDFKHNGAEDSTKLTATCMCTLLNGMQKWFYEMDYEEFTEAVTPFLNYIREHVFVKYPCVYNYLDV